MNKPYTIGVVVIAIVFFSILGVFIAATIEAGSYISEHGLKHLFMEIGEPTE